MQLNPDADTKSAVHRWNSTMAELANRRQALIDQACRNVMQIWDGKAAYTSWREHQLPVMADLHASHIRAEFRRLDREHG